MTDPNPELGGASGGAEDLELELELSEEEKTELGGDPLDVIQDETVRAQAKKDRAIGRRLAKKAVEPVAKVEKSAENSSKEFLTREDFHKSNERKALLEVTADPEIKANWAGILPYYTPRRGKETPEDIKEDLQDAITLYKARNPEVITDDSARDLTISPIVKSGGGHVEKGTKKLADPPGFKLPTKPAEWYGKKEA